MTMNENDKDIQDVLRNQTPAPGYDLSREETMRSMLAQTFRGKLRWMAIVSWVYMISFIALMVYSAISFFAAEATRDMILFATIFLTAGMMAMATKMGYWMLMNRNSITREIKRLELQINQLQNKIGD